MNERSRLNREAGAAAAGGGGLRVFHLKSGSTECFNIVHDSAFQKGQADAVHDHFHAIPLDHDVIVAGGLVKTEFVLEAGAAAPIHRQAQHQTRIALTGLQDSNAPGGAFGQAWCGHAPYIGAGVPDGNAGACVVGGSGTAPALEPKQSFAGGVNNVNGLAEPSAVALSSPLTLSCPFVRIALEYLPADNRKLDPSQAASMV
jgi:hypothetical protein